MRSIQNVKKKPLRHIHETDDIFALCQKHMSPGTPHSYLYPDLRVGIEPPKAWHQLYKPCLIPQKVSRETGFLVPCLQMSY